MSAADEKQALQRFLQNARGVLLWKLEGLCEYDIRRPMTPTGTNLLGLVKHCAAVDCQYFGRVLDRPFPGQDDLDWHEDDDAELTIDGAVGVREGIIGMARLPARFALIASTAH
jgi:hypothetical protein